MSMLIRSLETFAPHHQELRQRLIKVFLAIALFSAVAYSFSQEITAILIAPLLAASPLVNKLVYTNLPEALFSYLKLSLLVGLLGAFPVLLYQAWMFVSPGLRDSERRFALLVVFWASLLFAGGGSFAFFVVLPRMLHYFMSYASPHLEPLPKLGEYLTFFARTVFAFGLSFEIPFLMVMAGKGGLIRSNYFRTKRTSFYLAIVVLAFLLTAGDFMATGLLSIPLFALYEAGIFLTALFGKN